jgi:hypothetical protein
MTNDYEKMFMNRVIRRGWNAYCIEDENIALQGIYDDKIYLREHRIVDLKVYRCEDKRRLPGDPECEKDPNKIDEYI